MYIDVWLNLFDVQQKLAYHCKSAIFLIKKKKRWQLLCGTAQPSSHTAVLAPVYTGHAHPLTKHGRYPLPP